jgi:ribonuclease D
MAAMKETVTAIAAQLGLPEGLLCARRHMETLLTERAWPAGLNGWRRPILHDALMAQMP